MTASDDYRERKPAEIIINNAINIFLKLQSTFRKFQTITVSECCLTKLLPYILFEKCGLQCFDAVGWAAGRVD